MQRNFYLQTFSKNSRFFSENPSFFQNSSIYLTFLRNLSNRVAIYRVAFYSKLATINDFWKTETFFGITFFWKEPNFWTFREISLFHSYSASFCLSSACFKKINFSFQKNHLFFWITHILNFLRIILDQLQSTSNLLPSAFFENFNIFFGKPMFFCKKSNFDSFEKPYWLIRIRHQFG